MGLIPATPHTEAGTRMEAPVSVPRATGIMRAARAAPDPPELPPGLRDVSHGLAVGGEEVPRANSWVLSLPMSTAPASARRVHTVASKVGTKSARACEPAVVGIPLV